MLLQAQLDALNLAHQLADKGSLILADKSYIEQRNCYDGLCQQARLHKMHGLRHGYAQIRYHALTDWLAPKAGGTSQNQLTIQQKIKGQQAQQTISQELGHERLEVVKVYLGI